MSIRLLFVIGSPHVPQKSALYIILAILGGIAFLKFSKDHTTSGSHETFFDMLLTSVL